MPVVVVKAVATRNKFMSKLLLENNNTDVVIILCIFRSFVTLSRFYYIRLFLDIYNKLCRGDSDFRPPGKLECASVSAAAAAAPYQLPVGS